ncbi:MAG: hypothetical protein JNK65_03375 [Deltaproteobacteria bacterium]|nr:hypothetical protein [Deltaproteobacteria bacterium]
MASKGSRSFTFRKKSRVLTKVFFGTFGNIREDFAEKSSGMESKREVEEASIDVVWRFEIGTLPSVGQGFEKESMSCDGD